MRKEDLPFCGSTSVIGVVASARDIADGLGPPGAIAQRALPVTEKRNDDFGHDRAEQGECGGGNHHGAGYQNASQDAPTDARAAGRGFVQLGGNQQSAHAGKEHWKCRGDPSGGQRKIDRRGQQTSW